MQIWKEYRKACFRISNSSADLCEEAFYTYPSRIFNSSWANNYQLHMRHFTFVETEKYRKRKKKKIQTNFSKSFSKSFMLEGEAHKITHRALQPAVQSHKLLIKFFKLQKNPMEFRRGRRCTPEPKNLQQTHRTPAESLLLLFRKFY